MIPRQMMERNVEHLNKEAENLNNSELKEEEVKSQL